MMFFLLVNRFNGKLDYEKRNRFHKNIVLKNTCLKDEREDNSSFLRHISSFYKAFQLYAFVYLRY